MRSRRLSPSRALGAACVALATAAGTLTAAASPALAAGEAPLTALDTAYTQNFDTLASTGTSSVVPSGWSFVETGSNFNTTYSARDRFEHRG